MVGSDRNILINILQIDVEDWYCDLEIDEWQFQKDRIVESTSKVLDILRETNNSATFFILGYVGEHHPELVKRIRDDGHEVATHGYAHKHVSKQTPQEFQVDLLKSISILENVIGDKILGYRAPQFSIVKETSWAINILKHSGLKYDSSIFPVKTHLYGVPRAPLFPYHISSSNIEIEDLTESFWEIPLSVYQIPGIHKNIPVAGGFYLRFIPYPFIKYAFSNINKQNQAIVCYLHPWELDSQHPQISSFSWYHYWRLSSTEGKFRKLLKDFKFTSSAKYLHLVE